MKLSLKTRENFWGFPGFFSELSQIFQSLISLPPKYSFGIENLAKRLYKITNIIKKRILFSLKLSFSEHYIFKKKFKFETKPNKEL